MSGHIRLDKDLPEDARTAALAQAVADELWCVISSNALPKTKEEMCNALGWLFRTAALGAVVKLWVHADTHVHTDNTLDGTLEQLADVTALPLFLLQHYSKKWLRTTADGRIELPEYCEKNVLISRDKRREQNRKRVARWRRKKRLKGNALQKKSRKKSNAITQKTCNADVTQGRARGPARVRAHEPGPGPKPPKPEPGPSGAVSRETLTASRGELASAQGASLAGNGATHGERDVSGPAAAGTVAERFSAELAARYGVKAKPGGA